MVESWVAGLVVVGVPLGVTIFGLMLCRICDYNARDDYANRDQT